MEFLKSQSLVNYDYLLSHGHYEGQLYPRYDIRKSFYNKAKLYKLDGVLYLVSYTTIVAKIFKNYAQIFGWYSQTTSRHINEFSKQNYFRTLSKKQMENGDNVHGVLVEM